MDGSLIGAGREYEPKARDAEINGKPQRIEPLPQDQLGSFVDALIRKVHAPIGADTPTEVDPYFRTMARHPEMFRCQLEMGTALFTGRIPVRDRELAVLRVGWLLGAPYEWGEHVLIAKRYGVAPEEIALVIEGSRAPGWSKHEAAMLGAVEQMLGAQTVSDENWAILAETWDEAQLIEFPMMVGQYAATAIVQNALRINLTKNNAGLTQR